MPPGSPAAAAPAQQPGQRRQRGTGLSYVPDHVKNPHKYTCYVLEQPLVVGGGEQGGAGADRGRAEMERVRLPDLARYRVAMENLVGESCIGAH